MNNARPILTFQLLAHGLMFAMGFVSATSAQTKAATPAGQTSSQQTRQMDELRKEIVQLKQDVDTLKAGLELDEAVIKFKQNKLDSISLDLTQKAYQRLDADNGFFLVSVSDAVPYLNGYKILLKIGNPSYATYKDYKLKLRWSKPYEWGKYTQASYDEWNKAIHEKEISFPGSLDAGAWNDVDVVLAPVTADELGYLTLSIDATTVSLRAR
jgi:cell division protein FtsB